VRPSGWAERLAWNRRWEKEADSGFNWGGHMVNDENVILIVEDEADDMFLIKRAFAEAGIKNPVHEAEDCEAAIDYLAGQAEFADRNKHPMPSLLLLDLRLPDKSGIEVLQKIKNLKIKGMPVIVFTSSSSIADVKAAYEAGAASYVVKPLTLQDRRRFAVL